MPIRNDILIARHGETRSNRECRYAGWSDEPLVPKGRAQARRLAAELRGAGVERIRTSQIRRARQTADLIATDLGVPVLEDERLNELRMGPWEGLSEAEISLQFPRDYETWCRRPHELRLPGRETLDDLAGRIRPALIDSVGSGRRELLITHVAVVRLALLMAEGRPFAHYKSITVPNCRLSKVAASWVRDLMQAKAADEPFRERMRRAASA
jgi:broad specificity phosphatase PhoE